MMLRIYYYFPSDTKDQLFEEYSARKAGQFFNGRLPRPDADISMEFKLSKAEFEKMVEIHESELFGLIKKSNREV